MSSNIRVSTRISIGEFRNWSTLKKGFVAFSISILTFSGKAIVTTRRDDLLKYICGIVYIGSAIYTTSEIGVMERFGVSQTKATLGLTLYVLAYGTGALPHESLMHAALICM